MIAVLEGGVTDAEARRRRRGMHLAVIPAGLGLAVAAKENPVASGIAALTASAIIGAIVLMPPGQGGDPRDTAPGVIAGPQAPASPPGHPRQEPPPPPPVNLRPAPTEPSPQTPPKTQTADLRPAPTRRGPVDVTPITEQQTPDVARQACIRVRVTGVLAVRLLCGD